MDWVINSGELEDEVRKTTEVQQHDGHHTGLNLVPGEVGGEEEDSERDGDRGGRECYFDVALAGDNDEELDGETDEEEEIELQEGDIHLAIKLIKCVISLPREARARIAYLIVEKSLLHAVISSDVLQDIPSKFLIQFPRDVTHGNRDECEYARDANQDRLHILPDGGFQEGAESL